MSKAVIAAQDRAAATHEAVLALFNLIDKTTPVIGVALPLGRKNHFVRFFVVERPGGDWQDQHTGRLVDISAHVGVLLDSSSSRLGKFSSAVELSSLSHPTAAAAFAYALELLEGRVWGQPYNGRGEFVERTPIPGQFMA